MMFSKVSGTVYETSIMGESFENNSFFIDAIIHISYNITSKCGMMFIVLTLQYNKDSVDRVHR